MNKKQIIEALKAAGVEVDESLTVEALKALAAEKGVSLTVQKSSPSLVTVRVTGQAVGENDAHFTKGETFETTPERAAALGTLVEIVEGPAA